jgi:hypothetical protein
MLVYRIYARVRITALETVRERYSFVSTNNKINNKNKKTEMKKLTAVFLLFAATAAILSCKKQVNGEGPVVTETRNIGSFTGIELQTYADVYYTNSNERKIEVSAQRNILDNIETYVSNSKLVVRFKSQIDYGQSSQIRVTVSGSGVNSFVTNTAGSIYCTNVVEQSDVILNTKGSGNISIQKAVSTNIDAYTSGSGSITVREGNTFNEKLKTIGSGKIDMSGITAKTSDAHTAGSGSIRVRVTDHLHARIEGTGSIFFTGSPSVTSDIPGNGDLIHY